MLGIGPGGPGGNAEPRHILSLHDQRELTFRAIRPIAFQVDGEYVGEREHVTFRSVPDALRVIS
jgi:diacylglycerol kinase family enzyme